MIAPVIIAAGISAVGSMMSGKGGDEPEGYNIDLGQVEQAFRSSAQAIEDRYPGALQQYLDANTQAAKTSYTSFLQQNENLLPYSETAKDAMSELRTMLGMAPTSKTAGMGAQFQGAAGGAGDLESAFMNLGQDLNRAEKLTDPVKREAMRDQIMGQMTDLAAQVKEQQSAPMQFDTAALKEAMDANVNAFNQTEWFARTGRSPADVSNAGEQIANITDNAELSDEEKQQQLMKLANDAQDQVQNHLNYWTPESTGDHPFTAQGASIWQGVRGGADQAAASIESGFQQQQDSKQQMENLTSQLERSAEVYGEDFAVDPAAAAASSNTGLNSPKTPCTLSCVSSTVAPSKAALNAPLSP